MNKAKIKENVYLTERVKELIILNKEEKALSPIEILERIPETIIRMLTKGQTLKVKHNRILRHQRIDTYLKIMLKIMNKENL